MNFLYNLEFLMDRNKINRSELAKAIGIAPSTINAWYTKDYKGITLKNLSKLASYFDVSMEALVYGDRHSLTFTLDNYSEDELNGLLETRQQLSDDKDEQEIESIKTGIPILERCIQKYDELDVKAKNEILRSLIEKIEYNKQSRQEKFSLKIYMKI